MRHDPSISPHNQHNQNHNQNHQQQISPDYTHNFQPVSNLPPSLQQGQGRLPDDIWLAPPLEGDNGIGLSGVGDSRSWFGNSGGMGMDSGVGNSGESRLSPISFSHVLSKD
jgi:hypothetical protein